MAWRTCYSGSNNIDFNFPPIMNDGRNFATWSPDAVVNERIQMKEFRLKKVFKVTGDIVNFFKIMVCKL